MKGLVGFLPLIQSSFSFDNGELVRLVLESENIPQAELLCLYLRGLFHKNEECRKFSMINICSFLQIARGNYNTFVFGPAQLASMSDFSNNIEISVY